MSAPVAIALLHVPPSNLGQNPGHPIIPGVMFASSHLAMIFAVMLASAAGSFPFGSHGTKLPPLPPGAFWLFPALTCASLHFWTTFVIALTYFVNSPFTVCR